MQRQDSAPGLAAKQSCAQQSGGQSVLKGSSGQSKMGGGRGGKRWREQSTCAKQITCADYMWTRCGLDVD